MIPDFSAAIELAGRAEDLGVVELDVCHDGDVRVGDVRGVVAAAEADLGHDGLGGHVREPGVGGRRHELEPVRTDAQEALDLGHGSEHLGEGVVGDLLALELEPLVYPLEMRARVEADRQPASRRMAEVMRGSSPCRWCR